MRWRVRALEESYGKLSAQIDALRADLQRFEAKEERRDAVNEALAKSVHDAEQKQVTTRTFVVGLMTFFAMLAGVIVATPHIGT
jgi:hypothetical protein